MSLVFFHTFFANNFGSLTRTYLAHPLKKELERIFYFPKTHSELLKVM